MLRASRKTEVERPDQATAETLHPVDPPRRDDETRQMCGSSFLLAGRQLALGPSFITRILIIRYLPRAGYGNLAHALFIAALGQSAIPPGLDRGLTALALIYDEANDEGRLFGVIVLVAGVVTALDRCPPPSSPSAA